MQDKKATNVDILVLSGSHGAGHVQAAKALVAHAVQAGKVAIDKDILSFLPPYQAWMMRTPYNLITRYAPRLYGRIYYAMAHPTVLRLFRLLYRPIMYTHAKNVYAYITKVQPTYIITTHFAASELLDLLQQKGKSIPLYYTCITDYHYHPIWKHTHGAGYLVGSSEVQDQLAEQDIPKNRIHLTGIPVHPDFSSQNPNRQTYITVLLGGYGLINPIPKVQSLLEKTNENIVIICGKNTHLLARVRQKFNTEQRVTVRGWVDDIAQIIHESSRVVTKLGGLTTTECFVSGTPVEAYRPIPGQETENYYVFQKRNLLWPHNPKDIKNTEGLPVFTIDLLPF